MKLSRFFIIPLIATAALCACDNETTIGGSLVSDKVEVIIDSLFTVEGHSVTDPRIMSRTTTQLLGRLQADGYGRLSSDIVTQFMPAQNLSFANVDSAWVDSVSLLLFVSRGAMTGDSLMPMGVNVYRLNRQLPSPIYNNFDPSGYYSKSDLMGSAIYTGNTLHSDSLSSLSFQTIEIKLDKQFGVDLLKEYRDSTSIFYSPETFAQWFPGVYIANSFGDGRVTEISETRVNLYYRVKQRLETDSTSRDTIFPRITSCLAVTPEVITNNNLSYHLDQALEARIAAGEAILASPAGADIEVTLPVKDIIESYRKKGGQMSVLNTVSVAFPAEALDSEYGITMPNDLLMVLKSKRDEFFEKNQIADNLTSFYATYNSTTKSYEFSELRGYIMDLMEKEEITPDDYTFILTPVNVTTETSSTGYQTVITAMTPFITAPRLAKFNVGDAKINVVYSKQTIEF